MGVLEESFLSCAEVCGEVCRGRRQPAHVLANQHKHPGCAAGAGLAPGPPRCRALHSGQDVGEGPPPRRRHTDAKSHPAGKPGLQSRRPGRELSRVGLLADFGVHPTQPDQFAELLRPESPFPAHTSTRDRDGPQPRPQRPSGPHQGTRDRTPHSRDRDPGLRWFPARAPTPTGPEVFPSPTSHPRAPERPRAGLLQAGVRLGPADPGPFAPPRGPPRLPARPDRAAPGLLAEIRLPHRPAAPRPPRPGGGEGAEPAGSRQNRVVDSLPRGLRRALLFFQTRGWAGIGGSGTHVVNGRGKPRSPNLRLDLRRPQPRCSGRPASAGQSTPLPPLPPPPPAAPSAPAPQPATAQVRRRGDQARPVARGGPAPWAVRVLDSAGSGPPVLGPGPRGAMSFLSRQQPPPPRRPGASCALRQKLIFSPCSDCEEEEEEEEEGSGHSTGEDSAFQEPDSPLPPARSPTEPGPERRRSPGPAPGSPGELEEDMLLRGACPGADAPGGGAEGDSWEEEGFGSSSPVKSPAAAYFLGSSFSPVRCGGAGDASPRGCGARRTSEGPCSPRPDHPGTPPHKTFRKLRLFDTPHTPKVRTRGPGALSPRPPSLLKRPRRRELSAALPGFGYITARPHPHSFPEPQQKVGSPSFWPCPEVVR